MPTLKVIIAIKIHFLHCVEAFLSTTIALKNICSHLTQDTAFVRRTLKNFSKFSAKFERSSIKLISIYRRGSEEP